LVSIFDGPSGQLNAMCEQAGVTVMPPIDKVASGPYDMLNDVQFSSLMIGILERRPGLVLLAPECTAWSKAQDFNRKRPSVMADVERRQSEQRKVMTRMNAILGAVWTYGGEAIVKNP
jgi:hypothetical protein